MIDGIGAGDGMVDAPAGAMDCTWRGAALVLLPTTGAISRATSVSSMTLSCAMGSAALVPAAGLSARSSTASGGGGSTMVGRGTTTAAEGERVDGSGW